MPDEKVTPIPDAELAEVKRLHAAANGHKLRVKPGTGRIEIDSSVPGYVGVCGWESDAESFAALHNAFPGLLARIEAAERERDTATDDEAGHWIGIIRSLDQENLCDVFDGLGFEENLRQWLAARDAQQRRKGAAEVWGIVAERSKLVGDTAGETYATQAAKRLRERGE
jgi:hypothetical protein